MDKCLKDKAHFIISQTIWNNKNGKAVFAEQVFDRCAKKFQDEINRELYKLIEEGGSGQGKDGKTPVLTAGDAKSLPSGSAPTVDVVYTGNDAQGNPIYRIDLGIPVGKDGNDGITPELKLTEQGVEVSYNNGATWSLLVPIDKFNVTNNITNNYINNADEEDITVIDDKLKFADKTYDANQFSGLGRIYLRKNIVDDKNILTQSMINATNTIYIIQYDYDLNGATITIPDNSILQFNGGALSNGSIVFDNTILFGNNIYIRNCELNGIIANDTVYIKWFHNEFDNVSNTLQYLVDIDKHIIINIGTWIISNTVFIKENTVIIGEHPILSIIKADEQSIINGGNKYNLLSTVIMINNISITYFRNGNEGTYPHKNIIIRDIHFDTNRQNIITDTHLMCSIRLENCDNCIIDNCTFTDYNTIDNSVFDTQVYIVESRNCKINNCKSTNCSLVKILNCYDIKITNNIGNNTVGTWIETLAGESLFIDNNNITNDVKVQSKNSTFGINSRNVTISNNKIIDAFFINLGHVISEGDNRYYGLPTDANGALVKNNIVQVINYMAFYVQNANNIIIKDNKLKAHFTENYRPNEEWGVFNFISASTFSNINIINNEILITAETDIENNQLYTADGLVIKNSHKLIIYNNKISSTKRPIIIRNTNNVDDDYFRVDNNDLTTYNESAVIPIVCKNAFFTNNIINQGVLFSIEGFLSIYRNIINANKIIQVYLDKIIKLDIIDNAFLGIPSTRYIYLYANDRENIVSVDDINIYDNYYNNTDISIIDINDRTENKVCKLLNIFSNLPTKRNESKTATIALLNITDLTSKDKGFSSFVDVPVYWNGTIWINADGYKSSYRRVGTTSQRPELQLTDVGFRYYDTTLKKPFWWNGTDWITYPDNSGSTIATLTFTGAVEATYNGSTPVTVNIPTGGGTTNYEDLSNKPKIGDVELVGTKTLVQLGIQPAGDYATETYVTEQITAAIGTINTALDNINGEVI